MNNLNLFFFKTSTSNPLDSPSNGLKTCDLRLIQSVTTPTSTTFTTSSLLSSFSDAFQHHSTNNNAQNFNSKQLSSCNTQTLFTNEFQPSEPINQAAATNLIFNIKHDQINESKSLETLKSLLDQTPVQRHRATRRRSRNYEEDENFNSENDDENHKNNQRLMVSSSEERVLSNSSSLINLSSIQNSKMTCSATNSSNVIQTKSSSSSSSSKNGSNKNSLHGSIETMIEVS